MRLGGGGFLKVSSSSSCLKYFNIVTRPIATLSLCLCLVQIGVLQIIRPCHIAQCGVVEIVGYRLKALRLR